MNNNLITLKSGPGVGNRQPGEEIKHLIQLPDGTWIWAPVTNMVRTAIIAITHVLKGSPGVGDRGNEDGDSIIKRLIRLPDGTWQWLPVPN